MLASLRLRSPSSWNEWLHVKRVLLDVSPEERQAELPQCQAIIAMWRARGHIPHSIDITAEMVQLFSRDAALSVTLRPYSERELSMLYSLVVIRAINGITESGQQGHFARSVLGIAEDLGLPGWIVELRHDATHAGLPSLSVLRAACQYLLGWYRDNYWTPQYEQINAMTVKCMSPFHKQKDEGIASSLLADFLGPLLVTAATQPASSESTPEGMIAEWRKRLLSLPSKLIALGLQAAAHRLVEAVLLTCRGATGGTVEGIRERTVTLLQWLAAIEKMIREQRDARRLPFLRCLLDQLTTQHQQRLCPALQPAGTMPELAEVVECVRRMSEFALVPKHRGRDRDEEVEQLPLQGPQDDDSPRHEDNDKEQAPDDELPVAAAQQQLPKKRSIDDLEAWLAATVSAAPAPALLIAPSTSTSTSSRSAGRKRARSAHHHHHQPHQLQQTMIPEQHRCSVEQISSSQFPQGVRVCVDYPVWPAALLPGHFEAPPLHLLRECH